MTPTIGSTSSVAFLESIFKRLLSRPASKSDDDNFSITGVLCTGGSRPRPTILSALETANLTHTALLWKTLTPPFSISPPVYFTALSKPFSFKAFHHIADKVKFIFSLISRSRDYSFDTDSEIFRCNQRAIDNDVAVPPVPLKNLRCSSLFRLTEEHFRFSLSQHFDTICERLNTIKHDNVNDFFQCNLNIRNCLRAISRIFPKIKTQ
jgi:hypothetical protein